MKITERRLRSIIRQVIEDQCPECVEEVKEMNL